MTLTDAKTDACGNMPEANLRRSEDERKVTRGRRVLRMGRWGRGDRGGGEHRGSEEEGEEGEESRENI